MDTAPTVVNVSRMKTVLMYLGVVFFLFALFTAGLTCYMGYVVYYELKMLLDFAGWAVNGLNNIPHLP